MTTHRHPATVYRGERVEDARGKLRVRVTVGGEPLAPPPEGLRIGSGFEWGYRGAGPGQLALAILLDATGDRTLALEAYKWFRWGPVACWGRTWSITAAEVFDWLEQYRREAPSSGGDDDGDPVEDDSADTAHVAEGGGS